MEAQFQDMYSSTELSPIRPVFRRHSDSDLSDSISTVVNLGTSSRRFSSPCLTTPELGIGEPKSYFPTRKRSSILAIPSAPVLQPQHPPSIHGRSSWRLSFSVENRGAHLRKLSQGGAAIATEKLQIGAQPLQRWLHSQGLRSPSQAITTSEDTLSLDCPASHSKTCSVTQDFGGVDGGSEGSGNIIHLHEMGISQRLASSRNGLQTSNSSQQVSGLKSHSHGQEATDTTDVSKIASKSRREQQRTSDSAPLTVDSIPLSTISLPLSQDSVPLSQRIPESWGNVIQNGSFYPSARTSMQPTPESSRFNLLSLLSGSRSRLDLVETIGKSTFTWLN